MNKLSLLLALAIFGGVSANAADAARRQVYKLAPAAVKANAAKVAKDLQKVAPEWKKAPALYYTVDAMSDIKRVPDLYPEDGKLAAPVEIIGAKGEIEPGSFLIYPQKNVDKFELKVSDLKGKGGTIPASAVDLKLVKIWYQCGSGWFGFMNDPLQKTLTPELLVNDENLIWVDTEGIQNYARYNNADGSTHYEWISADFQVSNYRFTNLVRIAMLKDADTLQPVVLNKGEFKQFMATVRIPKDAKDGIYEGSIDMIADGKKIGTIPVQVGVLPFELPMARTNYNIEKPFMLSFYGTGGAQHYPSILKNLVDHNALHIQGFPDVNPANEAKFAAEVKLAKEMGVATRPLFSGPGVGRAFYGTMGPKEKAELAEIQARLNAAAAMCKKYLGHSDFYSYGADEGGPWTIRAERPTWRAAHAAGSKIRVSTHDHKRLLYALDYMILPRMPSEERSGYVKKFHEAHPDGMVGWYADPHSGPENPDYFRRIHGLMAYKADYDVASNYTWYRNDWNDFAIAYEPNYRGIIIVYAVRDRILDTLAWEGIREGIDDVRYASKLRLLAAEAEKSGDADTILLGKRALGYVAYWDVRGNPDTFRMECVNYIMQLINALKKEQK